MPVLRSLLILLALLPLPEQASGTDYFVHPVLGSDAYSGQSRQEAFQTLERASKVQFGPGDRLLLASGQTFRGSLRLTAQDGAPGNPITVTTTAWEETPEIPPPALIDFRGAANGILLEACRHIRIAGIRLTGDGFAATIDPDYRMRCGVLVTSRAGMEVRDIALQDLVVFDVFFENRGFTRGAGEVRTANGTQRYGWGIRVINEYADALITKVRIERCRVENVGHTGIKFTGRAGNIRNIFLAGNEVRRSGGPGIQMSEVEDAHVTGNTVMYSGSADDSRKWGRGSGLWTWGCSRVLIEKNTFMYANGPGDSAGAHIDFNCDHIILQYNFSAYNAGGFCEVLGNTYQCTYRYNVSINDGQRIKGVDGAFQEGKIFWLSGYQGTEKARKGPVNFYFYNNTIYCDSSVVARIAIDNTSEGLLIANNIFFLQGGAKLVPGDQYRPDTGGNELMERVVFQNNLFLNEAAWPIGVGIRDAGPIYGDPDFFRGGGGKVGDYRPGNASLVKRQGLKIKPLPGDSLGLWQPLRMKKDILGQPVRRRPGIGAIELWP